MALAPQKRIKLKPTWQKWVPWFNRSLYTFMYGVTKKHKLSSSLNVRVQVKIILDVLFYFALHILNVKKISSNSLFPFNESFANETKRSLLWAKTRKSQSKECFCYYKHKIVKPLSKQLNFLPLSSAHLYSSALWNIQHAFFEYLYSYRVLVPLILFYVVVKLWIAFIPKPQRLFDDDVIF